MSKTVIAALCCFFFAIPALAQDDFPRIQIGMGYANLGLPGSTGKTEHHSGFAMQMGFNFNRWLGIQNDTGYYSFPNRATLISNIIEAKVTARRFNRVTPFAVAGIGFGRLAQGYYYGSGGITTARLGFGADLPLNESLSIRIDTSRMALHSGGWLSGLNIGAGLVFNISN